MAFSFPPTPTPNQIVVGPGGTRYQWNNVDRWIVPPGMQYLPLSGGTMTGPLYLASDATAPMQAVPFEQLEGFTTGNVGRNYFDNSMFRVFQHQNAARTSTWGPWTCNWTYTADRWLMDYTLDGSQVNIAQLLDSDRTQIGDEIAQFALRCQFNGGAGATAQSYIAQGVDDTRRLANKTITLSFWASSPGNPRVGISYEQFFYPGMGGDTAVRGNIGITLPLSSTWQRYSFTFTLPSVVGKTIPLDSVGTPASVTYINFWLSCPPANTANYANSGNLGAQTGAVWFWGMQLEVGEEATPLDKPDPGQDLINCLRFYQAGAINFAGNAVAGQSLVQYTTLLVQMRSSPTYNWLNQGSINVAAAGFSGGVNMMMGSFNPTAAGYLSWNGAWEASADV